MFGCLASLWMKSNVIAMPKNTLGDDLLEMSNGAPEQGHEIVGEGGRNMGVTEGSDPGGRWRSGKARWITSRNIGESCTEVVCDDGHSLQVFSVEGARNWDQQGLSVSRLLWPVALGKAENVNCSTPCRVDPDLKAKEAAMRWGVAQ